MGVSQHPSAGLRSNYAIGNLSPGAVLAISSHLEMCDACRASLSGSERRRSAGAQAPQPASVAPFAPLPPAIGALPRGAWRRVRIGVRAAPLGDAAGLGESVQLVAAKPSAHLSLPEAAEFALVLDGTWEAGDITYEAGDFLEGQALRGEGRRAGAAKGCLLLVVGDDTLFQRAGLSWLQRLTRA